MGATVKAKALFCPKCSYAPLNVPGLVDHLATAHGMTDEEAAARAVEIVGDVDPLPANGQAIKRAVTDRAPLIARLKTCHYCHRTNGSHTPKCRVGGSGKRKICGRCKNVLPKHSANCPKRRPCFYCSKVAPRKCGHHGGVKKTSAQYKREKREAAAAEKWSVPDGVLIGLAAEIVLARERLGKLETAYAALSALR